MTRFVCETKFCQCSTEDDMKFCFKAIFMMITHTVGGICDNSRLKIIRLDLTATFV